MTLNAIKHGTRRKNRLSCHSHNIVIVLVLLYNYVAPNVVLSISISYQLFDHAILKKARAVATESDHPLSTFFHVLPSRRRYRCIKCKTSRYSRSFVPVAIRMLNAK